MEQNNDIKVSQVINLPNLNVKAQINMNIDANTHIKQVINIETYLIESQAEPLQNKAVVKGKLGVKVLYVDIDNIYNTLSDIVTFSETITNENILPNSEISVNNSQFFTNFDNDSHSLRVTIEGNLECMCSVTQHLNLLNQENDSLITKNTVVEGYNCLDKINKTYMYDLEIKLDSGINKILSCDNRVIIDETKCYDGYLVTSGQILTTLVCECNNEELSVIKIFNNSSPFKLEVECPSCDNDCSPDLTAYIDMNNTQLTTDIGDNYTSITFELSFVFSGYLYKSVNMNIVEDLYSLDSEIEIENKTYSICKTSKTFKAVENIDSEISLTDEISIDEILGMINLSSSATNYSIKQGILNIEGVVNGNLLYLDDGKEIKNMPTQIPFSINLKQEIEDAVSALHLNLIPIACKCKIKRGNILIIDYEVCINGIVYTQDNISVVENVKYAKPVTYTDVAFQIFIARPNETRWQLCKRTHTTEEKLIEYNKENPTTYQGGEKVIVYR